MASILGYESQNGPAFEEDIFLSIFQVDYAR
jgi:hypothetical protein